MKTVKVKTIKRKFAELVINDKIAEKEVGDVMAMDIEKRIPDKKFGLLLSGGIDSALIGKIISISSAKNKKFKKNSIVILQESKELVK